MIKYITIIFSNSLANIMRTLLTSKPEDCPKILGTFFKSCLDIFQIIEIAKNNASWKKSQKIDSIKVPLNDVFLPFLMRFLCGVFTTGSRIKSKKKVLAQDVPGELFLRLQVLLLFQIKNKKNFFLINLEQEFPIKCTVNSGITLS